MPTPIKRLVIVGGGSAGWMSAAMLSKLFPSQLHISLIESDDIGTIGVGEATIPPILLFNQALGIKEADFIRATQGTFKLGIQFENWGVLGDKYMHAFGDIGKDLGLTSFHHFWLRAQQLGYKDSYWDYSPCYQAAIADKFAPLHQLQGTPFKQLSYAYHFDASLYAATLRQLSEKQNVTRIEGKIASVTQHQTSGDIQSLVLESGQVIQGDLFIDCSGFRALLAEQSLKTGYVEWSHWLPCNRALAVPSAKLRAPRPYTRAIAHQAGWQWRIPLQHRTGNGLVYCSDFMSDESAQQHLLHNLEGEALAEPRPIRFTTGRRKMQWHKNCISLGLASGFLEPLESTSLHLIQSGIIRLAKLFPATTDYASQRDLYNRQSATEFEQIRDFIILHYHQTQREDSEFWQHCRTMSIPDSLANKIELFRHSAIVQKEQDDLFSEVAWQQVMLGQNLKPQNFHPLANQVPAEKLQQFMTDLKLIVADIVGKLPSHQHSLEQLMTRA